MTKQLLKGLWAVSFVAVLAALSAPVEAADVRCKVPFSFAVSGTTLPAGTYIVSATQGRLFIRGFDHGGAFALATGVRSGKDTEAKLVFHKYGDQYFLRQVWVGDGSGHELPPPRMERSLARAAQSNKVATSIERVVIPVL
jgi:hypothetical protein